MANYRKSFNLRNGVQVDDDNFIVNANGLVGIGTSAPTEYLLNVYGDTRVTGITTTKHLSVSGVATVGFLTVSQGIHVSSAVTATAFYGDGRTLSNIVGYSTEAWIINLARTGLSTTLNVGIGTTVLDAYDLLIGSDPLYANGISFDGSNGNIKSTGIITSYALSGFGTNITGINANNISNGTLSNSRLPSVISVGIITATTQFYGNLTGVASTADSVTTTANITVNSINSGLSTSGISTVFTTSHVGTGGTAFSALNSGRIGVGTALPTSEIQIRKASGSVLEVISDSGESRISIGQSVGAGSSSASLRFGLVNKTFDILNNDTGSFNMYLHAGEQSGINTGRFNWFYGQSPSEPKMSLTYEGRLGIGKTDPETELHVQGISTVTSHSYIGGDLETVGTISFGSDSNRVVLGGTGGVLNNIRLNSTSGVNTVSQLNVTGTSRIGIGTTNPIVGLDARTQTGLFNVFGVGTTTNNFPVSLRVQGSASIQEKVGIGTTAPLNTYGAGLDPGILQIYGKLGVYGGQILLQGNGAGIGVNTTLAGGAADFRYANLTSAYRSVFYPPVLTTSERNIVTSAFLVAPGAIIYNSNTNKHEGWDGSSWNAFW